MLCGRQHEQRMHAIAQAALVWMAGDMTADGVQCFLHYGELSTPSEELPYMPEVERKIAEMQASGGKLIVG